MFINAILIFEELRSITKHVILIFKKIRNETKNIGFLYLYYSSLIENWLVDIRIYVDQALKDNEENDKKKFFRSPSLSVYKVQIGSLSSISIRIVHILVFYFSFILNIII